MLEAHGRLEAYWRVREDRALLERVWRRTEESRLEAYWREKAGGLQEREV